MKRIIAFLLVSALSIALLGCSQSPGEDEIEALENQVEELQQMLEDSQKESQQSENQDTVEEEEEPPQETETPGITISDTGNFIPQTMDEVYLFAVELARYYVELIQYPEDFDVYSYIVEQINDVSPMNPGALSKYEIEEVAYYFAINYTLDDSGGAYHVKYVLEKDGDLYTEGQKSGGIYSDIDLPYYCEQFSIYELDLDKLDEIALGDNADAMTAVEDMIDDMLEAQDGEEDDEQINITGDENGMRWPGDKLPAYVPEIIGAEIVFVMDAGTGVSILFEGCTAQIAQDYEQKMIQNGWEIAFNYDSEGFHTITAQNSAGEVLQLSWDEEDGAGEIIFGTD